jgi:DNA-binding NtrC family response regulator
MSESSRYRRILIVDDERIISDTLATIFRNAGYDAKSVYSAEETLELLSQGDWVPDLAILDVRLPKVNGLDLAVHLKAEHPTCKLSLFSGLPSTMEILEAASTAGHSFDILAKPVHPTEFLDLASAMLSPTDPDDLPLPA